MCLDSLENSKCPQGNCIRLFALLSVGADAVRKVFVDPADFNQKKIKCLQCCRSTKRNPDVISRNYELIQLSICCVQFRLNKLDIYVKSYFRRT